MYRDTSYLLQTQWLIGGEPSGKALQGLTRELYLEDNDLGHTSATKARLLHKGAVND